MPRGMKGAPLYISWEDEYVRNPRVTPEALATKYDVKIAHVWRTVLRHGLNAKREAYWDEIKDKATKSTQVLVQHLLQSSTPVLTQRAEHLQRLLANPTVDSKELLQLSYAHGLLLKDCLTLKGGDKPPEAKHNLYVGPEDIAQHSEAAPVS